jgi:hypothetical protein
VTLVYQGAETLIIDAWLQSVFAADTGAGGVAVLATGGWHQDIAPRGTNPPYITWQHQSPPRDVLIATDESVAVEGLVLVKVVVAGRSYSAARPILTRIVSLIGRAQADIPNGRILSCVREGAFRQVETGENGDYRTLGYVFRYQAQAL